MNRVIGIVARLLPDPLKWLDDARSILKYGRGHKIEWTKTAGITGAVVERTINRYGIKTYWRDYGHGKDTKGFHVPAKQAIWADYILRKAGVPVVGRALSNVPPGDMPREWGVPVRGVGFAGALLDMLDPIKANTQRRNRGKRGAQ